MPGRVVTTRVVENVSSTAAIYNATATAPPGASITVSPASFSISPGATRTLTITIEANGVEGQQFGSIALTAAQRRRSTCPVAFIPTQASVALASDCAPTTS